MKRQKWISSMKALIVLKGLKGRPVAELCLGHEISQDQYYKWRDQFLSNAARAFETADGQGLVKQVSEHLFGPMSVGVGQGGLVGGVFHAQMFELSQAAGQAAADFAKAFGLSQLAKQHGHKVIPGTITLGIPLRQ